MKSSTELQNCKQCPFNSFESNVYNPDLGTGKLGAHFYSRLTERPILIVGQNPSYRRYPGCHSFSGKQGDLFRDIFGYNDLVFTNFVQVSVPHNDMSRLSDEEILHCIDHFIEEIKEIKPAVMIICGSFAHRAIEKYDIDVESYAGKTYYIKHPDYYLSYNRGDLEEYRQVLMKIKKDYDTHI